MGLSSLQEGLEIARDVYTRHYSQALCYYLHHYEVIESVRDGMKNALHLVDLFRLM